jgi:hypothetical protein
LPVHMRSRTLAHHGVLLRLAPAEVCRNQREDNAVGAPSLAEGSQASTSFSTAMNRSRLSRESMKSDEAAFKTASPPIPAASHSVARAGMRSGGMGSNRSGCQPLERPDWAPKVSLGWARVRGGRDGAVTEQHDCQPPTPEAIGQIWTCPVCEDSWVCKEGAVIGGEPFSWVRQPAQTE